MARDAILLKDELSRRFVEFRDKMCQDGGARQSSSLKMND